MSLDGFMADSQGSLDWASAATEPAPMGSRIIPEIGAILTGRGTYDVGMRDPEEERGSHTAARSPGPSSC